MNDAGKSTTEAMLVALWKKVFGIDVKCFNAPEADSKTGKLVDLMLCHTDQDGAQPRARRDGATLDRG